MAKAIVNLSEQEFKESLKATPRALLQVKDFWVKRILGFTRTGKSLVTESRLKPLSSSYRKFRNSFQGFKSQFFRPNKSNLTFTGQLLDSLKGTANVRKQRVQIKPTGRRKDGLTNEQLAEYVAQQGRPFLGIDEKGLKRIEQIIKRDLRRTQKKRLRTRN